MTVNKLQRFAENEKMDHVLEHTDFRDGSPKPKGRWQEDIFENTHPITLELGCGKANMATSLAGLHPEQNYVGIDIKGARIWKGAKRVEKEELSNVRFLRIYIEDLAEYFAEDEVSGIWLTYPDPWSRRGDRKKRLTSPRFLKMYQTILKPDGIVRFKTDDDNLFEYTLATVSSFGGHILNEMDNLYDEGTDENNQNKIKTDFEKKHLAKGKLIKYCEFSF